MNKFKYLLLFLCAGLIFSCKSNAVVNKETLAGGWELIEINGKNISSFTLVETPSLVINSSANSISGFTGCNRLNAKFDIKGSNLEIGAIATTRMACMGDFNESNFTQNLEGSSIIEIANNILTFKKGNKEVLKFKRKTAL